ncbi:phage prohead protease, HK97 family [Fructobacillus fructosus]|uniref:HK97 family phage prohead protease n=1 Tax=Fructobacillus fructosus TaxID=1631 RepID=UPI00021957EF|nr:HK97 family phage prohead protease [Fructobacillus fructosus]KRN52323.1 prohead protease [Fructobacillus fructosus KCTC 3544]GAP01407.1 phage prohead protease, HK97 family [Fructobacillus fructosus]
MKNKEIRNLSLSEVQYRNSDNQNFVGVISGYAVVFNKASQNLGGFVEYIEPTAFDGVDMSDVVALYDHDFANVLGRTSADTLKLTIDEQGLYFELNIPDTTVGRDVYTNIRAGNLQGMSFGFTVVSDSWQNGSDGVAIRQVDSIGQLFEVSVVTMPAYQDTNVEAIRSLRMVADKQKMLLLLDVYEKENAE